MATLTIQSTSQSNHMDSTNPTQNNNGALYIGESNAGTDVNRGLVKFPELSTDIPAGSTINSAVLTIKVNADLSDNARTLSAYRIKQTLVMSQSTWNIYSTGNNWQTAGGAGANDREATDVGTTTQPASPSVGDNISITLTASAVQEMILGGSFTNNGFLLQVATESNDLIGYYGSGDATTTNRPKLVVDYTLPGSSSVSASASASGSASLSPSASASRSASASASRSASRSASASASSSLSPSASASASGSASSSSSASASASASGSASTSRSLSPSASASASSSASASASGSSSLSASGSPSASVSPSSSVSVSPSPASYTDKYTAAGNTYADKYSTVGNAFTDKYSSVGNTYTDKYTEWEDLP